MPQDELYGPDLDGVVAFGLPKEEIPGLDT